MINPYRWNKEKNDFLKKTRKIDFEDIVIALAMGNIFLDERHPNEEKYPNQHRYVVGIGEYAYVIPYVIDEKNKDIFLKTIYPSRKYTKLFLS